VSRQQAKFSENINDLQADIPEEIFCGLRATLSALWISGVAIPGKVTRSSTIPRRTREMNKTPECFHHNGRSFQ
jgi:hypothetical protein